MTRIWATHKSLSATGSILVALLIGLVRAWYRYDKQTNKTSYSKLGSKIEQQQIIIIIEEREGHCVSSL